MAVARTFTCDKCGTGIEPNPDHWPDRKGSDTDADLCTIHIRASGRPFAALPDGSRSADLCPACFGDLRDLVAGFFAGSKPAA